MSGIRSLHIKSAKFDCHYFGLGSQLIHSYGITHYFHTGYIELLIKQIEVMDTMKVFIVALGHRRD